jgi:protein-tyrosine phosphatase
VRRSTPASGQIAPGVLLGRRPSEREAEDLVRGGVSAALDLTCESSAPRAFRSAIYLNVPVLDLTPPTLSQLEAALMFIEAQLDAGRTVYVYCALGYSRSACAAAAYLLAGGRASSVDEAIDAIRARRPRIVLHDWHREVLERFLEAREKVV